MFSNTVLIAGLFRFINFFILIGLVAYFFKKYLLGQIIQAIEEKNARHKALETEQLKSHHTAQVLEQQFKNQQEQYEHLLQRVASWEQATQQDRLKQLEQKKKEKKCLMRLLKKKHKHLKNDDFIKKLCPLLLKKRTKN